jgi:hypothetical protein
MEKEPIIYMEHDEQRVPLTLRIEWLPNGSINPLTYWTPDGECYDIKHIYEMIHNAHLKHRGVGIRFKIRSEPTEPTDPFTILRNKDLERYIYLADNWFCGKNIIDERYDHAGKEFIHVTLDVFPDGRYMLVYFVTQNQRYMVEKVISIEPRGSSNAGGVGMRHKVEARLINADNDDDPNPDECNMKIASLFFEINKWFRSIQTLESPTPAQLN